MSKRRPKVPDYRFPWCDVCEAHRKEVDGVRHQCEPKQREQLWLPHIEPAKPEMRGAA